LTVIGQAAQFMPGTSSVTLRGAAAADAEIKRVTMTMVAGFMA
jgi:hypothetical protein